jgi:hypothetical protein
MYGNMAVRCGRLLLTPILLFVPLVASGELAVKLRLEHTSLLQFEAVNAFVTINNDSNYTLSMGKNDKDGNSRIEFVIEKQKDERAQRINQRPLISNFKIKPGETWEAVRDLSAWYDLRTMGRYTVRAIVYLNGQGWESNTEIIDVVGGLEIASVSKSLPGYDDLVRTYSLRYWSREGGEFLFLHIGEEKTGINYGVVQLGPLIRVYTPVIKVDKDGNVTVFHQSGADCYIRSVFKSTKKGVEFVDQTYHLANGDPYPFKTGKKTAGGTPGKK